MAEPTAPDEHTWLVADASDAELVRAAVANHVEWLRRSSRAAGGRNGTVGSLPWAHVPGPAPELMAVLTAPVTETFRADVDGVLDIAREIGAVTIGYWLGSAEFDPPAGALLAARGFRPGTPPHWMALDLADARTPLSAAPGNDITLAVVQSLDGWEDSEVPSLRPGLKDLRAAMVADHPKRVWHFVAWRAGRPIGQATVHLSPGPLGVAGLNDTYIVPGDRSAGLSGDRMAPIYRFAADHGCRYVVVNAAQESGTLYRFLGYRTVGYGQSWWLHLPALDARPNEDELALAEAIGLGDVAALERLSAVVARRGLADPFPNGRSALELAAAARQSEAGRWLLAHGAELDVLSAWDLGWPEEAAELLRTRPELRKVRREFGESLLHAAVQRNDPELARLLLRGGVDTEIRDERFDSTALDWARTLRKPLVATEIRRHLAGGSSG